MEASALNHAATLPALGGRSPLLRLKSDEQLITLVRRGQTAAFEALVQRYQSRLLAFCRHMLGSTEDAEDVLQEVFAASFNAMLADDRPINARPWLYRIARNRCLNHLRRPQHAGQDSMDVFERDGGLTTADAVHKREEFRQIVADVQDLPETQKTALLLREIDALSYDQIAEAMETTVPSVKSLLVRARVSLAEAAEARLLTCEEVRMELGQVAEGLAKTSAPVRRHLKSCDRCRTFKGELRRANRALAAIYPLTPLIVVKKFAIGKIGAITGGTTAGGSGAAAGLGTTTGGAVASGAAAATGASAGSALSAGLGALATKAAAGLAAVAIVGAGAVEVKHVAQPTTRVAHAPATVVAQAPQAAKQPFVATPPKQTFKIAAKPVVKAAAPTTTESSKTKAKNDSKAGDVTTPEDTTVADTTTPATPTPVPTATPTTPTPVNPVQEDGSTVVLDPTADGNSGDDWDQPGGGDSSDGSTTSGTGSDGSTTSGSGSGSGSSGSTGSGTTGQQSSQPGAAQTGSSGDSSSGTGSQTQQPPAPPVAGETAPPRTMHRMRRVVHRLAHP